MVCCDKRYTAVLEGRIYFRPEQQEWFITFREGRWKCHHKIEKCPYCLEKLPDHFDCDFRFVRNGERVTTYY